MKALLVGLLFVILSMTAMAQQQGKYFFVKSGHIEYTLGGNTTGIKFDVAKATIKPESMGTINYVVKMMTDHPELNFSVEGHTDSDGESASNQKLSEARAKAVTETMINAGISADRLSSKGYGETKPRFLLCLLESFNLIFHLVKAVVCCFYVFRVDFFHFLNNTPELS